VEYERPIPLAGDILKQRIFSPLAYASVTRSNIVAICHAEVPKYAPHFPVAWHKSAGGYELSIVRSLMADGRGHPRGSQTNLPFLPILCRAYPFMYAPSGTSTPTAARYIDGAIATEPGDIGAPICFPDGRPTKATAQRLALLDQSAAAFSASAAITLALTDADLFEPWPLHFEGIEDTTLDVADMWIIKQAAAETGALASVLRQYGLIAADLVGLHRISLFRAGTLLANARMALKQPAPLAQVELGGPDALPQAVGRS
jgi:SapC